MIGTSFASSHHSYDNSGSQAEFAIIKNLYNVQFITFICAQCFYYIGFGVHQVWPLVRTYGVATNSKHLQKRLKMIWIWCPPSSVHFTPTELNPYDTSIHNAGTQQSHFYMTFSSTTAYFDTPTHYKLTIHDVLYMRSWPDVKVGSLHAVNDH